MVCMMVRESWMARGTPRKSPLIKVTGAAAMVFQVAWVRSLVLVIGSSTFPSNPAFNPTLTIQALAYMSADAIVNKSVKLASINRSEFESLLFTNKDIAYTLLWTFVRTLSERLRETNEKIKAFFAMTMGFQGQQQK